MRARSSSGVSVRSSQSSKSVSRTIVASSATSQPGELEEAVPLRRRRSCGHGSDRAAGRPPRPHSLVNVLSQITTRSRATRAISLTAASASGKWCAAMRQATTSKLESANGRWSAGAIDVRLHPRRSVDGHDLGAGLAQPPRDVAAARRDVEHGHARARLAPLDDEVEIVAGRVRRALAVRLARGRSRRRSFAASSTARRAPSSIVASGWMFSRPASARIAGPPPRSSRRAGRRSDSAPCRAGRAPRGSRARPRRSA